MLGYRQTLRYVMDGRRDVTDGRMDREMCQLKYYSRCDLKNGRQIKRKILVIKSKKNLDKDNILKNIKYRVIHVSLTFLIWLKMALEYIVDVKARHFYNPEDPPFDMKHQLKSADSLPVVKIDLRTKVYFHSFFFHFYRI